MAWGMCERHAWGYLLVDAAFRRGYLHGPVVLYEDLMQRANDAVGKPRPAWRYRALRDLRAKGPCLMCELGYGPSSLSDWRPDRIARGREPNHFRAFAERTKRCWEPDVCGSCVGARTTVLCRRHLLESVKANGKNQLQGQASWLSSTMQHITNFSQSFGYERRGSDTEKDRAALISAVGWCSGWRTLFDILER